MSEWDNISEGILQCKQKQTNRFGEHSTDFFFSAESGFNISMLLRLSGWKSCEEFVKNTMNQDLYLS